MKVLVLYELEGGSVRGSCHFAFTVPAGNNITTATGTFCDCYLMFLMATIHETYL